MIVFLQIFFILKDLNVINFRKLKFLEALELDSNRVLKLSNHTMRLRRVSIYNRLEKKFNDKRLVLISDMCHNLNGRTLSLAFQGIHDIIFFTKVD